MTNHNHNRIGKATENIVNTTTQSINSEISSHPAKNITSLLSKLASISSSNEHQEHHSATPEGDNKEYLLNYVLVLMSALIILGVFGNLVNIVVFSRASMRKASTFRFLLYLAITDLLVLIVCATDALAKFGFEWELRSTSIVVCRLHTFLTYLLTDASSLILMVVSVDRALVVTNSSIRSIFSTLQELGQRKIKMLTSRSSTRRSTRCRKQAPSSKTRLTIFGHQFHHVDVITAILFLFLILLNSHYLIFLNISMFFSKNINSGLAGTSRQFFQRVGVGASGGTGPNLVQDMFYSSLFPNSNSSNRTSYPRTRLNRTMSNYSTTPTSGLTTSTRNSSAAAVAAFYAYFLKQSAPLSSDFHPKPTTTAHYNRDNSSGDEQRTKPNLVIIEKVFGCCPILGSTYDKFLRNVWFYIDMCVNALIPFVVMSICSLIILGKVRKKNKKYFKKLLNSLNNRVNRTVIYKRSKKSRQILYMLLLTNSYFIVSQLPYWISFYFLRGLSVETNLFQLVVHAFSYTNNALNFLFYGFSSQYYRKQLLNIFSSRRSSLPYAY